jgi:mRNA export factor
MCWSPKQNLLVATSWDNQARAPARRSCGPADARALCQVRCYEVQPNGSSVARASFAHDAPVLSATWHHDGASVFSGGCDKQARRWDLGANTQVQVAAHDAPIRHLAWVAELSLLVTGGWDRTLRYWDARSPTPAHTHVLPERCYALSVAYPLLVVATAERHIQIFNLASNPGAVYKQLQSPLKYQTRCVAAFPDKTGYLLGSIEGRVAVQHVEEALAPKNFTFKCHRHGDAIHAVNACVFHPVHGTFVTTGSDGCYNFWDKDSKQRLKQMQFCGAPIPCGAFNADGSIFAYAASYDWSKGAEAHIPTQASNTMYLHATQEADCKPRPRAPGAVPKR